MSQDAPSVNRRPGVLKGLCVYGTIGLVVVLAVLVMMIPMMSSGVARESARQMACRNNLKQITVALYTYHDAYGCFPPAYTVDDDGKPLHSWRVLILPYLEQNLLYSEIALDEPWDSVHNRQFHDKMPSVFHCPSSPKVKRKAGMTSYMFIVGPDTVSDGSNSVSLADVLNEKSKTVMLIEAKPSVNWMAPVDIQEWELAQGINKLPGDYGIGSYHKNGINLAFVDGSCRFVSEDDKSIVNSCHIRQPGTGHPAPDSNAEDDESEEDH